jgi:hypothetical protein
MRLSELDEHEQRVLIGLVKLVVHADQVVSAEERAALAEMQRDLGAAVWNQRVHEASERFPTIDRLEEAARAVQRPVARHRIHGALAALAGSDELIEAEEHVLRWIDQEWGLHDDDEEPESFELISED